MALALLLGLTTAGYVSASTGDALQPAKNVGSANIGTFDSIRIGNPETGGVTYFNGSIVNIGEDTPVTFGDDVRIDGAIWRGVKSDAGTTPVMIYDNLSVNGDITVTNLNASTIDASDGISTMDTIYALGNITSSNTVKGQDLFAYDTVYAADVYATGTIYSYDWYTIPLKASSDRMDLNNKPSVQSPISYQNTVKKCDEGLYGHVIFSEDGINNGLPNEFYGCTGRGWVQL